MIEQCSEDQGSFLWAKRLSRSSDYSTLNDVPGRQEVTCKDFSPFLGSRSFHHLKDFHKLQSEVFHILFPVVKLEHVMGFTVAYRALKRKMTPSTAVPSCMA